MTFKIKFLSIHFEQKSAKTENFIMSDFQEFKKLRKEISDKMKTESGKEWIGQPEFRDLEDVRKEIRDILRFIRGNSLFRVFRDEGGYITRNWSKITGCKL